MMKKLIQFILAILIAVPLLGQTASPTVTLDQIQDVPGTVHVDLVFKDFDDDVGAITLFIEYDLLLLTYTGPQYIDLDGKDVNVSTIAGPDENWLGLTWINEPDGSDFSAPVTLTLQFTYTGGFKADLAFVEGHPDFEIAYTGGSPIDGITYTDGFVEPAGAPYDGTLTLSTLEEVEAGTSVEIYLVGTFTQTANSANLYIGFDGNLEFTGFSGNNAGFQEPIVPDADGVIELTTTDVISDGNAITLNFIYLGGGTANIRFLPGSEVGDDDGEPLHVGFVDGEVTQGGPIQSTFEIQKVVSDGATIGVDPNDPNIEGVEPVEVIVGVTNSDELSDVGVVQLYISYDTEKLEFKTLLGDGWALPTFDEEAGIIQIIRQEITEGYDLNDDELLFELKFEYNVVPGHPDTPESLAEINFLGGSFVQFYDGIYVNIGFVNGWVNTGYELDVKVFLEGPYREALGEMDDLFQTLGYIPEDQPYNTSPWNYSGNESATVPAGIVDWLYIQIREATSPGDAVPATIQWEGAVFLNTQGQIVALDGTTLPVAAFVPDDVNDLFIVIYHRTHLAVMSAVPMTVNGGVLLYDFSNSATAAYDANTELPTQKELAADLYGMFVGDVDQSTEIDFNDMSIIFNLFGDSGYSVGDVNMDNQIDFDDVSDSFSNQGFNSYIPE